MKKSSLLVATLMLLSGLAQAGFEEDLIQKFPSASGATISPAFGDFYLIKKGNEVLFMNRDLTVMIPGKPLTTEPPPPPKKIEISVLDTTHAIRFTAGNGSRKLFVFSDPDCPFCQKLERELTQLTNIDIYVFPMPIAQLHPQAMAVSESIWCSKSPTHSWRDYVLKQQPPVKRRGANCNNTPINQNIQTASELGISGTPALIFEDGSMIPGFIPAQQIEFHLNKASQRQ